MPLALGRTHAVGSQHRVGSEGLEVGRGVREATRAQEERTEFPPSRLSQCIFTWKEYHS